MYFDGYRRKIQGHTGVEQAGEQVKERRTAIMMVNPEVAGRDSARQDGAYRSEIGVIHDR